MPPKPAIKDEWVLNKSMEMFITDEVEIEYQRAQKLAKLFEEGFEVAYVARYRPDVHGGLSCENVRKAHEAYNEAKELNKKVAKTVNTVVAKIENSEEKVSVAQMIKSCNDVQEVAEISKMYASTGTRKTKATIARELGFEEIGRKILAGEYVNLKNLKIPNFTTQEKIEEQIVISVADLMNRMEEKVKIVTKISKLEETHIRMKVISAVSGKAKKSIGDEHVKKSITHFKDYVDFDKPVKYVLDHQILALERAEENEILTWRVDVDVVEAKKFHPFRKINVDKRMLNVFMTAVDYSVAKLFVPKIQRATRRHLSQRAQNSAIKWFSTNIEQLFCREPLKSTHIIALDPGFSACKAAFLKPDGSVIETNDFRLKGDRFDGKGEELLKKWVATKTSLIFAIGNGKATYETQRAIAKMIDEKVFKADVTFCVVPEDGASKYSITAEAAQEFPGMEATQISAVSIGRRLIDPMGEFVKIEPQHLGKGMYQHSINCNKLKEALEMVVRETVSMRGVDVNCASEQLLRQVCGLNKKTAAGIVEWRKKNGGIRSREELKSISGIGKLSYTQCAGFLTVLNTKDDGEPAAKKRKPTVEYNPFDATIIHPDQYNVAKKVLKNLGLKIEDVGNIQKIQKAVGNLKFEGDEKIVVDLLLTNPRLIPPPPLLKTVRKMASLKVNEKVTGVVLNQTSFGIFVDIGVEKNALAHANGFKKDEKWPEVGTSLEFQIDRVDIGQGRISVKPV